VFLFILLFISNLFNDVVSDPEYMASKSRMIVDNELERVWKETVMV
jgi:hypothetical protein